MKNELLLYKQQRFEFGFPLYRRVALWHVFQKFQLESGTALSVEYHNCMSLSMGGDLEGPMHAWDTCIQAMRAQPDVLIALGNSASQM